MNRSTLVLFLIAALGGVAAAQPAPGEGSAAEPPPPPPPPPAPPPMHHMMADPQPAQDRPEGLSFAIGAGYQFPTSLETPNVISARVRLPSGLTFEPLVKVTNDSTEMHSTPNPSMSTSRTELAAGALVRYPVISHGRTDFELLGIGVLDTVKTNPDGPDNDSRTTTFALGWGIGIGFWITHHWQLSFAATNPIFTYSKISTDNGPGMTDSTTNTVFGVVFDPVVALMIHLYN